MKLFNKAIVNFIIFMLAVESKDLRIEALSPRHNIYAYYVPNTFCTKEDARLLNTCTYDLLPRLKVCNTNDLLCECRALKNLERKCFGLCTNSIPSNFLSIMSDVCRTLDGGNLRNVTVETRPVSLERYFNSNKILIEKQKSNATVTTRLGNKGAETKHNSYDIYGDMSQENGKIKQKYYSITYTNSTDIGERYEQLSETSKTKTFTSLPIYFFSIIIFVFLYL
ncbi:uncharacterized protein SCDLUD_001512 [Saccharomycodes ludwigii]|uniref:uncharacterized protein n=1 Tax=Saccharomycodes ludwigii TaxID=36035 RepID=UPI001E84116A|nr:hypothetical protein SCDLUD_001512 [Saccharomycodes ludwigii]KAH3901739.1 hypothetical protein SCDLUD_001512 [Saccharomycodes ludwigii]